MMSFADSLLSHVQNKGNPCLIGLDYHEGRLPDFVRNDLARNPSPEGYRAALSGFFRRIIAAVAPLVPAVKPQISLLESMTWVGAQVFMDVVAAAREHGLVVIADAKRGDIASSAVGYAKAFLGGAEGPDFAQGYRADAMTVNPFLGRDTLDPYLDACRALGKGVFVLVRTSNKGSVETQNIEVGDSRTPMFAVYARMVDEIGASLIGEKGYSSVGAVVGATFPDEASQLRALMPRAIFLVPGYGAQGATADDVARNFNADGLGAIVNASRSVTYGFERSDISPGAYDRTVRDNVLRMAGDIAKGIERRLRRE